jgi:DNA-directed RNA polymerase subunit RPC12/RpoP
VKTRKLQIHCPVCGSAEVFYSCTPNCCFNHVCAACGTTFEPATVVAGGKLTGLIAPDPFPDATDPTTECAACHATTVYMTDEGAAVCGKCGSLLKVELTEIVEGG